MRELSNKYIYIIYIYVAYIQPNGLTGLGDFFVDAQGWPGMLLAKKI